MKNRPNVLIIDGDRFYANELAATLSDSEITPTITHDGNAGLAHALTHPPDAIVLDWQLKYRSGFLVLEYLQRHSEAKIPIVISSEIHTGRHVAYGNMLGVQAYFHKADEPHVIRDYILESLLPAQA